MAQSRPSEEVLLEKDAQFAVKWHDLHRDVYVPVQNFMMILSLFGFACSLHCLYTRWPKFRTKPFSPAHVAFVFPILSHTNAVQAYRSGYNTFSDDPKGSPFHLILFGYWFTCLVAGTILNLVFTGKYIVRLPEWTKMDVISFALEDDERPPSPNRTFVHELWNEARQERRPSRRRRRYQDQDNSLEANDYRLNAEEDDQYLSPTGGPAREVLNQTFTSPAVLQANEAGSLVRVRRGTEDFEQHGPYVRTRNVTSLGFDLTLTQEELRRERAELLDWVARNAPRTRNRTLSIPQMFKLQGGEGIITHPFHHPSVDRPPSARPPRPPQPGDAYGTFSAPSQQESSNTSQTSNQQHQRSSTWGFWSPV